MAKTFEYPVAALVCEQLVLREKRIKELKAEVKELRDELELLYGSGSYDERKGGK